MPGRQSVALLGVSVVLTGSPLIAQDRTAPARPAWAAKLPLGYLVPGSLDASAFIAPAPVRGDGVYGADRKIFKMTRKLQGTPRWKLATSDLNLTSAALMRDFSCAAGKALTPEVAPEAAPKLNRFTLRVLVDSRTVNDGAKRRFKRLCPSQIDKGEICQPKAELISSYDYPSGHTVLGWTWAYTLAELFPDRTTPILARDRAYGQSRLICRAHNTSAVQAGALIAATTIAALHGVVEFRSDLDAVRAELQTVTSQDPAQASSSGANDAVFAELLYKPKRSGGGIVKQGLSYAFASPS